MDKNKDGVVTLEEFIIACQEVCITPAIFFLFYIKHSTFNLHETKSFMNFVKQYVTFNPNTWILLQSFGVLHCNEVILKLTIELILLYVQQLYCPYVHFKNVYRKTCEEAVQMRQSHKEKTDLNITKCIE